MESGDAVICGELNGEMAKLGLKGVWDFFFLSFFLFLGFKRVGVLIIVIAVFGTTKLEIEHCDWDSAFLFPSGSR